MDQFRNDVVGPNAEMFLWLLGFDLKGETLSASVERKNITRYIISPLQSWFVVARADQMGRDLEKQTDVSGGHIRRG